MIAFNFIQQWIAQTTQGWKTK